MSECLGITGRLFGHHYVARITAVERENDATRGGLKAQGITPNALRAILVRTEQQYHGDVCTRCGHVVNADTR